MNSTFERDPKKRRVKPIENQPSLLDFDLGESSDDSDFRIEDHAEPSDDDDDSAEEAGIVDSSSDEKDSEEDSVDSDESIKIASQGKSVADLIEQASKQQAKLNLKETTAKICCGCLGDRSDDANEIVECDGCGVTVHEGCYGVSDSASVSSTVSSCSTEPWFCEACRAGVTNPVCELCPNSGGIYKETDVGKWVHLVCALYVPGVAFGEVDQLTSVTLFEMPYSRWGARTCCLCEEQRFARTGVCIGCDAGMCRTYFHVTCAQREGFLSEAHSEEVDQADPFYAHCKLHSDKTLVRRRKRNWLVLQLRTQQRRIEYEQEGHGESPTQLRIQRKLNKYRQKYLLQKSNKIPPWVPTQKMPRLLTTSASACRRLLKKADLMGIDTMALEMQEGQVAALMDVRKKWHIPPAFSVEFIGYYLDRNSRLSTMKQGLEELLDTNAKLLDEQQKLRVRYDQMMKESSDQTRINVSLKQTVHKYHSAILSTCPNKSLPAIDDLGRPPSTRIHPPSMMSVPTAAALKMGVGFPLANRTHDTGRVLSCQASRQDNLILNNECGICHQRNDQHLLAKCDTCHLYYHLYCLNPPLTRLPKKSKLYGWQCSECDKTSGSEPEILEVKSVRRRRTRYSKDDPLSIPDDIQSFTPVLKIKPLEEPHTITQYQHTSPTITLTKLPDNLTSIAPSMDNNGIPTKSKKRRRDKHRSRYSPDMLNSSKEHKRKRKKKSLDIENPNEPEVVHPRITIKIKSIPLQPGEKSQSKPQMFYVPNEHNEIPASIQMASNAAIRVLNETPTPPRVSRHSVASTSSPFGGNTSRGSRTSTSLATFNIDCCVCNRQGSSTDTVQCDDCLKNYHFTCLEPPVKKTPKRRGYSWHCADCDPTASDTN